MFDFGGGLVLILIIIIFGNLTKRTLKTKKHSSVMDRDDPFWVAYINPSCYL